MTTEKITSLQTPPITSRVLTRPRQFYSTLPSDGRDEGWLPDPRLRPEFVRTQVGASPAIAGFTFIPLTSVDETIEQQMRNYSIDDQVRIVVDPIQDQGVTQFDLLAQENGEILFEGILQRNTPSLQGRDNGDVEQTDLTAFALSSLDNQATHNIIRGRMVAVDSSTISEIETPDLPAVFNFRGRPNLSNATTISAKVAKGQATIAAPLWTHDDDSNARPATLARALQLILVSKLYGNANSHNRNIDIDPLLALELIKDTFSSETITRPEQFRGLDDQLPEINVQGLGALDAIEQVCTAGKFDMAIEVAGRDEYRTLVDRRHVLRIWRKNTGDLVPIDLAKAGSSYSKPEQLFAENNINAFSVIVDGAEIRNSIYVVGRSYVEAQFPLKPLWKPADIDSAEINASLQKTPTAEQINGSGYYAKHVVGGAEFKSYGHVGRVWGIDCTGDFDGYESSEPEYQHDEDGFDFVSHLDLNNVVEIQSLRQAAGVTDPIVWTKRIRHALPMVNPHARKRGINYILEVSEDAGETWYVYPRRFSSLRDLCGFKIDVENLASFNLEVARGLKQPGKVDVDKSWWKLISTKALRMRATFTVIADHANRWNAPRRVQGASIYDRAQWLSSRVDEYWIAPNSPLNDYSPGGAWWRIAGILTRGDDELQAGESLQQTAERRREQLEDVRMSVTIGTPLMLFKRYRLGNRISGVRGRNISFATRVGNQANYPNVVGVTYNIGNTQSIQFSLTDQRLAEVR